MSDELFDIPATPLPPLAAARLRLELAIEAERKAAEEYVLADEDEMTPREYRELEDADAQALYYRKDCEEALERLEREALLRENQRHSSTGT